MTTLKQLAARHRVNESSLRVWLSKETSIRPTAQVVIDGHPLNEYDRDAAAAVARFLKGRPKRSVGRPSTKTAGKRRK